MVRSPPFTVVEKLPAAPSSLMLNIIVDVVCVGVFVCVCVCVRFSMFDPAVQGQSCMCRLWLLQSAPKWCLFRELIYPQTHKRTPA